MRWPWSRPRPFFPPDFVPLIPPPGQPVERAFLPAGYVPFVPPVEAVVEPPKPAELAAQRENRYFEDTLARIRALYPEMELGQARAVAREAMQKGQERLLRLTRTQEAS